MSSRIPLETLFGNPEGALPTVSPDGTRLAYVAPVDDVLNLWVAASDGTDARPVTHETDQGIGGRYLYGECPYQWEPNGKYLLYLHDREGDENAHLYRVEVATGEVTDLTPFEGVQAQLIATSGRVPDHAMVALNKDDPARHDAYRIELATGAMQKVAENFGFLSYPGLGGWLVDQRLEVRGAIRATPDGGAEVLVRRAGEDEFEVVLRLGIDDSLTSRPLRFTEDGNGLYLISSEGAETGRLVRFDLGRGEVAEVLAEDPRYDLTALGADHAPVVFHPQTGEPQLVPRIGARHDYIVLDATIAEDIANVKNLHPGDFILSSRDLDDRLWVVTFKVDDGPFSYYLYDRKSRRGTHLFDSHPAFHDYPLAKMEPFTYTARDGLVIEGYLSFPPGKERGGLPTVVVPHGGPYERDEWGFNPRVQFLGTRGYLVVQVNYRGSLGYGKTHLNAGNKEWGGKMHDDLVDALEHVIGQGYADRERLAIMGGSYGGYAALVGATATPDLFRCAVAFYGPSSLITMIEGLPPFLESARALFTHRVGDLESDRDLLRDRSPISKADAVTIPMFIAQGAHDPGIQQAQSDAIVSALEERGVPHEYVLLEDEGHGFVKPQNNIRLYSLVERFLAQHLGETS